MSLDCLDGLVGVINDQDTRDDDVVYLNDLPDITFEDVGKIKLKVKGDITSGSAVVSNLTMNTSNFNVGDKVTGTGIPANTEILSIDTATQITLDANATETCIQTQLNFSSFPDIVFERILGVAKKQLKADVMANFQGCLSVNSVVSNNILGHYYEYMDDYVKGTGAYLRGVQVYIDRYPYLEFYVHKIRLFLTKAITDNIYVYDLVQKKLVDTISFTSVANEITDVDVNKAYSTDKQRLNLVFVYNGNLSGYVQTTSSKRGTSCKGCGSAYRSQYILQNGCQVASGADVVDTNLEKGGDTYGMSLTYSLNCTIEPFLCSIRNLLQFPLYYLAASHLLKNAKHDSRINTFITIHRDSHAELAREYLDEYKMQMFGAFNEGGKKIKQGLMDSLVLPKDICFRHNKRVTYKTVIP